MPKSVAEPIVVKVTEPWKRFIVFCQHEFPEGEVRVRIVAGQPCELLEAKRKIRFDRPLPTFTSNPLEHTPQE